MKTLPDAQYDRDIDFQVKFAWEHLRLDTVAIGKRLGITEAEAANRLARIRDSKLG